MKNMRSLRIRRRGGIFLAAVLFLTLIFSAVTVRAADDDYTYTIRVFGGNMGTVNGKSMVSNDKLKENGTMSVTARSTNSKYYVVGFCESGREDVFYAPGTPLPVTVDGSTRDRDYVVVYGVEGKTVRYKINYVDKSGKKLAESREFYGNVGSNAVMAYRYIENYFPDKEKIQPQRLSADASKNEFDFVYKKEPVE